MNFFSWVFDGKDSYRDYIVKMFDRGDFDRFGSGGESSDMIVDMDIETYLGLCEPIPSDDRKRHINLGRAVERGEIKKFQHIPCLNIRLMEDGDGEHAKVFGHDGRHRAMFMRSLGYSMVPVRLSVTGFKWGADMPCRKGSTGTKYRYPEKLWCQNDKSKKRDRYCYPFPVEKKDSGKAYSVKSKE